MASYIQININTANAPHFATWYHNRSGQAMSYLTAAVLNYAIKRQFLLIGYAPKNIFLEELPKIFQIRIKGNESLVKWENDLKMASLNKRRTIEYILEQSISTDTPISYTQAPNRLLTRSVRQLSGLARRSAPVVRNLCFVQRIQR